MRLIRTTIATTLFTVVVAGTALATPGFLEDVEVLDTLGDEVVADYHGWVAANVEDLDGDGVDDLAVPAIFDNAGGTYAGSVSIHSGATRAVLATHAGSAGDILGHSVSGAGDVDADGTPDYVAGAPDIFGGVGEVFVWSGADHRLLWTRSGPTGAFWAGSVSTAGDVDRDGSDDVLVGAEEADGGRGRVEVLSGVDGAVLWSVDGRQPGDGFGSAVGLVGDVDGDGIDDLSVGAYRASGGRGAAYVLSGRDGSEIHRLHPRGFSRVFGQYFASGAGDVDGDGIGDVYIGDYAAGRASRPGQRPSPTHPAGSGAAYVFSGATGQRLHRFAGGPGEGVGPGRGVGDVDGDGHADLVVAGYTSSAGGPQAGRAWVRSGRTGEVLQRITSTTPGERFGVDALGLGDVDGDGRTDFVVTAVSAALDGRTYLVAGTTG